MTRRPAIEDIIRQNRVQLATIMYKVFFQNKS